MKIMSIFPFLASLLLAGCSLHQPTATMLPDKLPGAYQEQFTDPVSGSPSQAWWRSFADPRLDDLVTELFQQNLNIEQALARLEQARATSRKIRGTRFPNLNLSGEASRSMQPSFAGDYTGDSLQLAAAAAFEIDLWGRLAARHRAARNLAEAAESEVQTLYLGLVAQLADLYYLAVEQRAQLRLTDETVNSFTDTLERVESRYRMGLVPAVDVYQSRQSLAAARARRHQFEATLAQTEHAIAVIIGRFPDQHIAGDLAELPSLQRTFPHGLPADLLTNRPDLRAALARVRAADQEVAAALAERFPALNLLANFGETRQEFATGLISGSFWSLLGDLTLPVVDAGRRRAEVDRTRAVVREALAAYQQSVLEAVREVEDALAASRTTELRIARLRETERATQASLRLSLQNYLQGVNDYLPVLTAQRNLFEVQSGLLSARRQQISHRISLARALGGSWMQGPMEERLAASDREE